MPYNITPKVSNLSYNMNADTAIHIHCDEGQLTFHHYLSVSSVVYNFRPRNYLFFFTPGHMELGKEFVEKFASGLFYIGVYPLKESTCDSEQNLRGFVMSNLLENGGIYLGENTLLTEAGSKFTPGQVIGDAVVNMRADGEGVVYVPRGLDPKDAGKEGNHSNDHSFHVTALPCIYIGVNTNTDEVYLEDFSETVCVFLDKYRSLFTVNNSYPFTRLFPLQDLFVWRLNQLRLQ